MGEHTRGPWTYEPRPFSRDAIFGPNGKLAEIVGDSAEAESNAHLMAAAPDLLHILEVIRDADRDCGTDGLPHNLPPAIRAMVDAAIAKATSDSRSSYPVER